MTSIKNQVEKRDGQADYTDFVHTGPDTLAGRWLRMFWQPVYASSELAPGKAKPIRVMGEDFTLYRGQTGAAHLVGHRCAHRGTQLSVGWVEGDCIRCFYHGWKYDASGQCVEQPAEPRPWAEKARIRSCPTYEYLGMVYGYFGEGEPPLTPRFPELENFPGVVRILFHRRNCNYFQDLENGLDASHAGFVHSGGELYPDGMKEKLTLDIEESQWGATVYMNWPTGERDTYQFGMPNVQRTAERVYTCKGCLLTKVDNYTVQLTRPSPTYEIEWLSRTPGGNSIAMHSKRHFDTAGEDKANKESVGTGPWELIDAQVDAFRKMKAVRDQWRQTPNFEEMVWWDISEQSTRVANFSAGLLDTGQFSVEAISEMKQANIPGVKFMSFPGGAIHYMFLYGQQYHLDAPSHQPGPGGEPAGLPVSDNAFDCSLPWVSCDRDLQSDEWAKARKVRLAMAISIDRQKLINNIVFGEGRPWFPIHWGAGAMDRIKQFGLDELEYPYDPGTAGQLLVEAGYPDGFTAEMILDSSYGYGPNEIGQAITTMWDDIGINIEQKQLERSAYRPTQYRREASHVQVYNPWPASPVEPILLYEIFYSANGFPNFGFEHPWFDERLDEAHSLMDDEARWAKQAEMAQWLFDNVVVIPLFDQSVTWPLSSRIDTWEPQGGDPTFLSNWESVPHRG